MTRKELYETLSPKIRNLVMLCRDSGFETIDSGDGTNHAEGMGCAMDIPHVFISLPDFASSLKRACDLLAILWGHGASLGNKELRLEISHSPLEGTTFIFLTGLTDDDIEYTPEFDDE